VFFTDRFTVLGSIVILATTSCGPQATSRAPEVGNPFVPTEVAAKPATVQVNTPLGSLPTSEMTGIKPLYKALVNGSVVLGINVKNKEKKTATAALFASITEQIPPQQFPLSYSTGVATIQMQRAVEGIHRVALIAVYADKSQTTPICFDIQIGASTARVGSPQKKPSAQSQTTDPSNPTDGTPTTSPDSPDSNNPGSTSTTDGIYTPPPPAVPLLLTGPASAFLGTQDSASSAQFHLSSVPTICGM
jgi:hypothetical protein